MVLMNTIHRPIQTLDEQGFHRRQAKGGRQARSNQALEQTALRFLVNNHTSLSNGIDTQAELEDVFGKSASDNTGWLIRNEYLIHNKNDTFALTDSGEEYVMDNT